MSKMWFSKTMDPEKWCEDSGSVTIKPRRLMTAVLWVLRKIGFKVHDLR